MDLVQSAREALGQVYVERHFPPENKARMVELVDHLLAAFAEGIDDLAWMTPRPRPRPGRNFTTFRPKIGYPDKWRDYSELVVVPDDLVGNVARSSVFEHDYEVSKLGSDRPR